MLWLHLVVGDHGTTRVIYYVTCVQWNCDLAGFKMMDSKMETRSATTYTELPKWKWLNKSAVSLDWMGPKIGNYLQSAFINLMSVSCKPSPICLRASVISLGWIMIVWRQVGSHQVTYAITLHLQVVTKKVRLGVFGHIWSANMKKVNVITGHQQITRRDWIDEKKKIILCCCITLGTAVVLSMSQCTVLQKSHSLLTWVIQFIQAKKRADRRLAPVQFFNSHKGLLESSRPSATPPRILWTQWPPMGGIIDFISLHRGINSGSSSVEMPTHVYWQARGAGRKITILSPIETMQYIHALNETGDKQTCWKRKTRTTFTSSREKEHTLWQWL